MGRSGSKKLIRLATVEDGEQVAAIYAPFVADTAVSFETVPPTGDEMGRRIREMTVAHPWLVCERERTVLGYAYASSHRARAAYHWSVDVSVYVHGAARRSGVGTAVYTCLFRILVLQGFYNAYAGITLPNPASVALHELMGFKRIGVYEAVGYKLGAWHDVSWWWKPLRALSESPQPASTVEAVRSLKEWDKAIGAGLRLLRPWKS